jgi:uncharacterized protein (TIGR00369 family)
VNTSTFFPPRLAWLAQEKEMRQRLDAGAGPGVARPDQVAGKTGLEVMQGLLSGELPYASIAKTLDFLLIEVSPGQAIFQGTPGLNHMNPLGTVHGGWFATLLDSALGCAVHTMMPPGRGYTTADLSVKLVKALTPKVQRVRAIAKVLHCGRQLATAEARWSGPTARCTPMPAPPALFLKCLLQPLEINHETSSHHAARGRPATLD